MFFGWTSLIAVLLTASSSAGPLLSDPFCPRFLRNHEYESLGIEPSQNILQHLDLKVSVAQLQAEASALREQQPWNNDPHSVNAVAWFNRKTISQIKAPVSREIFRRLKAIPEVRTALDRAKKDEDVYITLFVDSVVQGEKPVNATPLWHTDSGNFGPNPGLPRKQLIVQISDSPGVSPTQFLSTKTPAPLLQNLLQIWSPETDQRVVADSMIEGWDGDRQIFTPSSGDVLWITSDVVHRKGAATSSGWRLFFRIDFF